MEETQTATTSDLAVLESVRCLECDTVYAKPAGGGTALSNPGCPECGYVGWISASIPFSRGSSRRHYVAGRQRHRSGQSG